MEGSRILLGYFRRWIAPRHPQLCCRQIRVPHQSAPTGLNDLGNQGWPGTGRRRSTQSGSTTERTVLQGTWLPVALLSASKCRPLSGFSGFSHWPPLAASNIPGGILDLGDHAVEISSTHAPYRSSKQPLPLAMGVSCGSISSLVDIVSIKFHVASIYYYCLSVIPTVRQRLQIIVPHFTRI